MKGVCNASPLISLARAGLADVLNRVFDEVVLPERVAEEIARGSADDPARQMLDVTTWLKRVRLDPPVSRTASLQLGPGETDVIEWALRSPDYVAILDDRAARRAAGALGVRCCGTLGVLAMAVRAGILPSFTRAAESLHQAGLYVNRSVIRRIGAEFHE